MNAAKRRIYLWLPVVALLAAVSPYLLRQLWFDEALTVLNFACLDSAAEIYTSYVIPNNQLLFSVVIHYWIKLYPGGVPLDLWLRLPSLLCALVMLVYMGRRFRRFCGALPLAVTLTALAISPPFLVYATAVRGYMLGALLVVVALGSALDFCAAYRLRDVVVYEVCVFLAVLTVPSDLAALAGALLFVLPALGRRFWRDWRAFILVFAPAAAFMVAYLPIWKNFLQVAKLGEGWHERGASVLCVYIALSAAFGILPLALLWRGVRIVKKRAWHRLLRGLVWLLPIPAAWIFKAAPFPRVYFPLFPVLALAVAIGLRDISLIDWKKRLPSRGMTHTVMMIAAMLSVFILWGALWRSESVKSALSRRFGGDLGDDFFRSYYLRRTHRPALAAEALEKLNAGAVYFSFLSDPWSIIFYHMSRGGRAEYLFDGPRGRVPELPAGTVVVIRRGEDPLEVAKRFDRVLIPVELRCPEGEAPDLLIFIAAERRP